MNGDERYVVVGLGGVGGIVLRNLVSFLRHRGKPSVVYAVDGDSFEERNRDRQFFGRLGPKAEVLAEELCAVSLSLLAGMSVPVAARPTAMGRSSAAPALGRLVGTRLTVTRPFGNSSPLWRKAARMRSRLSPTTRSPWPTM